MVVLVVLSGLAVVLNTLPLNVVFGLHIMLGPAVAVLALLLWRGWVGLAIGSIASLSAWNAWGHPWGPLFLSGEMIWLTLAVNLWQHPEHNPDDGVIVLLDIAFWLLIAGPLIFLLPHQGTVMEAAEEWTVFLKQLLNGMITTTLGFITFIIFRLLVSAQESQPITLRGLIAATILSSISIPIVFLSIFSSRQLADTIISTQYENMKIISHIVSNTDPDPGEKSLNVGKLLRPEGIALRRQEKGGEVFVSDPDLFQQLYAYRAAAGFVTPSGESMRLLIPEGNDPLISRWLTGYWVLTEHFDAGGRTVSVGRAAESIEVAEKADLQVREMEEQAIGMLFIFVLVMLIGSIFSQWFGLLISREFQSITAPLQNRNARPSGTQQSRPHEAVSRDWEAEQELGMPLLPLSRVGELQALLTAINDRIHQVNRLTVQLRSTNQELSLSRDRLAVLSVTDALTGCLNRRSLEQRVMEAMNQSRMKGVEFSMLCFDIDHFKQINDTHGHHAGDAVICFVVNLIRGKIRKTDCFFRMGGDEFLILLEDCSMHEANRLGSMLCQAVASADWPGDGSPGPAITISVGVVTYRPLQDSLDDILRRADEALYAAKTGGRNRVSFR